MSDLPNNDGRPTQGGSAIPVSIVNLNLPASSAVPTGGATSAKQDTGNTSLASIDTKTNKGAANIASSQVASSTSAATAAVARATRRSVTIKNLDTSITVYVGPATVTSANGMQLKAGESISITWVGLIQVIAASGTPTVAVLDEYE